MQENPKHWQPQTDIEKSISHSGNQLNPYMYSYPIKGRANLAELSWYFLLASMDSGFGYYDENTDDHVKPSLSFKQSLYFSKRFMQNKKHKDKTGPSIWWPQRYPYNPGSVNNSKAQGWATLHANTRFALYTYAYDLNGIKNLRFAIRVHPFKRFDPEDISYELYEPRKHSANARVKHPELARWKFYPAKKRSLQADINGVAWQKGDNAKVMQTIPGEEIADLYYHYFNEFKDELIDYYVEAEDYKGNITKSAIQHVYVGTGLYEQDSKGKWVEAAEGRKGQDPFSI